MAHGDFLKFKPEVLCLHFLHLSFDAMCNIVFLLSGFLQPDVPSLKHLLCFDDNLCFFTNSATVRLDRSHNSINEALYSLSCFVRLLLPLLLLRPSLTVSSAPGAGMNTKLLVVRFCLSWCSFYLDFFLGGRTNVVDVLQLVSRVRLNFNSASCFSL